MNKKSNMLYIDKAKDSAQRSGNTKNTQSVLENEQLKYKVRNSNKYAKIDNYENTRTAQLSSGGQKNERKNTKPSIAGKPLRHSASYVPLTGDISHTPRFEVYLTHTLVAKQNPSSILKVSNPTLTKSRSDQLFQIQQSAVTIKPHHGHTSSNNVTTGNNPKISRTAILNPEQNRSMSAVYKSQTKSDIGNHKNVPHGQQPQVQSALRSQARPPSSSITNKQFTIGNMPIQPNYDSLNRTKSKDLPKVLDDNNDKELLFYSLPRKPKTPNQNGGINQVPTKRMQSNPLYIDTGSSRKTKVSPNTVTTNSSGTTVADGVEDNLINFSQTLARAATNSPPIKRRSSSILHSPNPKTNARFATKSTIDEIYTQKNRKDNYEKYKKVANEILKENFARKFGKDYTFNNKIPESPLNSSSETLSSTSSGTDQQHSISSIPPDDIPLDIPNQYSDNRESFNANELFFPQKPADTTKYDVDNEDNTNILEGTVTSDGNHLDTVDSVHVSDDENDESGEYNLDKDPSSSPSYASDNDGDIEEFIALNPIERIDDKLTLDDDMLALPDHQHSQSFRIENTSIGSIVEVFVHADSLQRAKDALLTVPHQGILSKKSTDIQNPKKSTENQNQKKRRALLDPHILLLDACLEPDYELVKELIPRISDISRCTIDGITALHNAVCSADAKVVLFLIQSGANVNASDNDGWTPLHCAACCNNRQISKLLVENGASLFAVTLSDFEIPSQKCNKTNQEDTQCEEYLFWEQENLGVVNGGVVYSLFEYVPQCADELPLLPNKILKVIDNNPPGETGWFLVEDISGMVNVPKQGLVASAYVSCYPLVILKQH